MPLSEALAEERLDRVLMSEIDGRLELLLANYQRVTANPRSMGYLRFLLKHYAKSPTPWRDCVKDNMKRFGPGKTEALCLAPDTPVSTPTGLIALADLRPGDLVWSWDGEQLVVKPVLWSGCTRKDAIVSRLEVEDDIEVYATADHPFLRYNGDWADVSDLAVGDFLLGPLSSFIGSRGLAAASSAIPFSLPNTTSADTKVFRPRMTVRAKRGVFDFSASGFNELVHFENLSDLLSASRGHQGLYDAHDCNGVAIVDTPFVLGVTSLGLPLHLSGRSETECVDQPFKRLEVILRGDYAEVPSAGTVDEFSFGSVKTEASFALEESSCITNILGREITKVSLMKECIDVWDIEVADTHNFVVHDFIIAHNCGVLKDAIRQTTYWRHGHGGHSKVPDTGAPGVAIGEADREAAPAWGGHRHGLAERQVSLLDELDGEFGIVDHTEPVIEAIKILCALGEHCDVYRVLLGLDEAPLIKEASA